MKTKSTSIWVWVGCGCAAVAGVAIVLIAAGAFFGIRTAKAMADPVARHDKALRYLEATALPDGYETEIAMKVPFVAELVVLQGDDAQFVSLGNMRSDADLAAAFVDDESFDREIRRAGLTIRRGQTLLARESLQLGQAEIRYALLDGPLDFDATGNIRFDIDVDFGEVAAEEDEINAEFSAVILVRCSSDDTPSLGLWSGPRAGVHDGDLDDATAEQAALRAFIEQFGFCDRPANGR